jgi:hypothetical protein
VNWILRRSIRWNHTCSLWCLVYLTRSLSPGSTGL